MLAPVSNNVFDTDQDQEAVVNTLCNNKVIKFVGNQIYLVLKFNEESEEGHMVYISRTEQARVAILRCINVICNCKELGCCYCGDQISIHLSLNRGD